MYVRNWKTANKKALRINGTPLFLQETVYTFSSICQILFSDIFEHLGMCKMLCVCLSIRSYFIHDTFKKLSFAHHAKFIFPLYTSKCQKCCRNISLTPNTYVIFSVFEYTFFIIARQPSVWHPPFSGLFLFSAFYVHREVFSD